MPDKPLPTAIYREYSGTKSSEEPDQGRYLSYPNCLPVSTTPDATPADYARLESMVEDVASPVEKQYGLNQISRSRDLIKEIVNKNPSYCAWGNGKRIAISEAYYHKDWRHLFSLLCVITCAGFELSISSIHKLIDTERAFLEAGFSILSHLKGLHVRLNLQEYLGLSGKNFFTPSQKAVKHFFEAISDTSFTASGPIFQTFCANEMTTSVRAMITALLNRDKVVCDSFFALCDEEQKTPLIATTLYGMDAMTLEILQVITSKNIDVQLNAKDVLGHTALDYAWVLGRTEVVKALLKAGAKFSSELVLVQSRDDEIVNTVLDRALLCGARHFQACTNYFYFQHSKTHYPIMYSMDKGINWNFVVMHPDDPHAITLYENQPNLMTALCRIEFESLKKTTDRRTYREHLWACKNDLVFLREAISMFVKLGLYEETVAMLESYPEHRETLLRETGGPNLLQTCTNSYQVTSLYVNIAPAEIDAIVRGRLKLAGYFFMKHPELLEERTLTSQGMEKFSETVQRLKDKGGSNPYEISFNTQLYSQLFKFCTAMGVFEVAQPVQAALAR